MLNETSLTKPQEIRAQLKQMDFISETLKLSIPLIISSLVAILIPFLGILMLGRLGHTILAASALITSSQNTVFVICMGVIFSISAMVGQAYGAKNYYEIGGIVQQGYFLALLMSIPIMLLFWNMNHLLICLGQKPVLTVIVQQYFHAYVWAVPAAMCLACGMQFLTGLSKKSVIFIISLLSLLIVIPVAWVLIFGKLGFSAYGVTGLGYAGVIQAWLVLLGFIAYLYISPEYKIYALFQLRLGKTFGLLKKLFQIGWPICVQMGSELIGFSLSTLMIGWIGAIPLAARQISIQFIFLMVIPLFALSQASSVLVSRAIGSTRLQEVKLYGDYGILLGLFLSIIILLLISINPKLLVGIFITNYSPTNSQVVSLAAILLIISAIGQIFDGIRNVSTGALRGLFDTKFPMIISLISLWIIALPLGYVMAFTLHWGIIGLSIASNIGFAIGGIILFYRWRFMSKKHLKLPINFP